MKDFFSKYDLYKEFLLIENYNLVADSKYTHPYDFIGETFDYYCPQEGAIKTFELDIDKPIKEYYGKMISTNISSDLFVDNKLDFTFKAIGQCKSCGGKKLYLLLHVYSNKPICNIKSHARSILGNRETTYHSETNIYIKKVGASPEIKITSNKTILKYFDRETSSWYYKAADLLRKNYGIGAFAYFRRIVEKELINIINAIKVLPDSQKENIQKLLDDYDKNPRTHVIYESIFEYLPNSLKILGDNPIKLLYNQMSEGLHSLTEEECLERAKNIAILLEFTIQKIYEEKSTLKDVKDAIGKLK
jgi:hypothetical protein